MGLWSRIFSGRCDECQYWKDLAFRQIDSNQLQLMEAANLIASLAKAPTRIGPPTPLSSSSPGGDYAQSEHNPEDSPRILNHEHLQEIDILAQEFFEAAVQRGMPYTEDAKVLLRADMRQYPEKYNIR